MTYTDRPKQGIILRQRPSLLRTAAPLRCRHDHRQLLIGPPDNAWLLRAVDFLSHLREIRDVACIQINRWILMCHAATALPAAHPSAHAVASARRAAVPAPRDHAHVPARLRPRATVAHPRACRRWLASPPG